MSNIQGCIAAQRSGAIRVERPAAMRFGFDGDGLQTAVIAVASALPAAVAHPRVVGVSRAP